MQAQNTTVTCETHQDKSPLSSFCMDRVHTVHRTFRARPDFTTLACFAYDDPMVARDRLISF
jgi:hypothetical protein